MKNFIKFLYLALLPIVIANNYCSLCSDHTMCQFMGKNPSCGKKTEGGVTSAEIKEIVDLHNSYREKIANGEEKRGKLGPQPPAGNMEALVWDEKLAEVAQRWADQCTFRHDKCRNDPRFDVGQNIYLSSGFSKVNWTRAINSWYNEIDNFSAKNINNFKPDPKTGHFTQIAWATTTKIGCGRMTFNAAYRPYENRQQEFILSEIASENNNAKIRIARQDNPGFFGGAKYDSSGAMGAITSSSKGVSGFKKNNPGFFGGATFNPAGAKGAITAYSGEIKNGFDNMKQNNPGFFGGATFNPAGAKGAITANSAELPGSTASFIGNKPSKQNNPGFFGGATFNPAGAKGAITANSAELPGSTASFIGNKPSMQNNPGFFGGATFNPAGAKGAITANSAELPGSTASFIGNKPSMQNNPGFFGGATFNPAGAKGAITANSAELPESIGNKPSKQNNPGFFGGATFNPQGAKGAITANSAEFPGSTSSFNGNKPSRPTAGDFHKNVNGGSNYPSRGEEYSTNGNYLNYGNYQSTGNGPYFLYYPNFPAFYSGGYDFNSGSYLQSYGNNLLHMHPASVKVDNEDSSHEDLNNLWIPLYHNLIGKDHILICNYGPSGNLPGKSLYLEGEKCSKCPSNTTCKNGLCVDS